MENRNNKIANSIISNGNKVEPISHYGKLDNYESRYQGIWVFAEQRQGKLEDVVFELLGEGRRLSVENGAEVSAVLIGNNIEPLAKELIAFGADKIYLIDNELLENYTTEAYTKVFSDLICEHKPEILLLGATHFGRDLAPRVAARIGTGLTADCVRLDIDPNKYSAYLAENTSFNNFEPTNHLFDGCLKQTLPAFGGNLMATIVCPEKRPQMATVRRGVMNILPREDSRVGELIRVEPNISSEDIRTKVIDIVKNISSHVPLNQANIVCAGGRGVGGPEGFKLINDFAEKIGATVGCSRAAVDAGWIDEEFLIGQTGNTVKPSVYYAFGISGAVQHTIGMQNSDLIIAINNDPNAPIFNVADYGIVGNLHDVIPELLKQMDQEKQ